MKLRSFLAAALLFAGLSAFTASAAPIALFSGQTVTTSSNTQLGRLSRNNQPQTWTGAEPYPGVVNPTTTYYYNTYTLDYRNLVPNNFVEISFTDTAGNGAVFISAYHDSYNPTNKQLNWLGDLGYNSIAYGTADSLTFQVGLQYLQNLVLVVNNTGTGTTASSGLNNPFDIYVNAYTDTMYDDATVTGMVSPEPSTFIELGTGLLAVAGVARRRLFARA